MAIQRQLPGSSSLTVAYVGSKGIKLQGYPDLNMPIPGTSAVAQRRPYPAFGSINTKITRYNSSYHAMQIVAERRFTSGLGFQLSYVYSHDIDDIGALDANSGGLMVYNTHLDRANSDLNVPHRFVANWTYQIPFRLQGWRRQAFAGWQLNGILTLSAGLPVDLSSPNTTNCCSSRPDRIRDGNLPESQRTPQHWFDTAAFREPGLLRFGNAGRNLISGPGTKQLDFSLFKEFPFGEARRVEFRSEFFNLFNTPQFNNPSGTLGSAAFGTITAAGSPISFQRTSRQIQFGLKIYF
jgi:hypothetical protein